MGPGIPRPPPSGRAVGVRVCKAVPKRGNLQAMRGLVGKGTCRASSKRISGPGTVKACGAADAQGTIRQEVKFHPSAAKKLHSLELGTTPKPTVLYVKGSNVSNKPGFWGLALNQIEGLGSAGPRWFAVLLLRSSSAGYARKSGGSPCRCLLNMQV